MKREHSISIAPDRAGSLKTEQDDGQPLLLNYSQMAQKLNISVPTMYTLVRKKILRPIKIGSRSLFDPEECLERLKKRSFHVSR